MMRLLLRSKYDVFERHHERLRRGPDPIQARVAFRNRLIACRRVNRIRVALYGVVYFAVAAAVVGFLLQRVPESQNLRSILDLVAGVASSLTILAFAGILAANRFLNLADIELHYYSAEARLERPAEA